MDSPVGPTYGYDTVVFGNDARGLEHIFELVHELVLTSL
jgi:hypothetical protein